MTAKADSKLTQARLKELLHYNPDTGVFTWLTRRGCSLAGDVAGAKSPDGTIRIYVDNIAYAASRLVWLYVHGEFPQKDLRRKNKDRSDNRIDNFFDPRLPMPKVVHAPLTAERLRELVNYDPSTGIFTRRIVVGKTGKVGDVIGHIRPNGRLEVSVEGVIYLAHRVAWLYMTGSWPEEEIDHIDGDPLNNRFDNLRDISRVGNAQNQRWARSGSISGILGVHKRYHKWRAVIVVDGQSVFIGSFPSKELAQQAYINAKRELHFGCTI